MNLRYKILFNVELRHEYHSNLRCEDFEIVPSSDTKSALKGLGMLFKVIANRLVVLMKRMRSKLLPDFLHAHPKYFRYAISPTRGFSPGARTASGVTILPPNKFQPYFFKLRMSYMELYMTGYLLFEKGLKFFEYILVGVWPHSQQDDVTPWIAENLS